MKYFLISEGSFNSQAGDISILFLLLLIKMIFRNKLRFSNKIIQTE